MWQVEIDNNTCKHTTVFVFYKEKKTEKYSAKNTFFYLFTWKTSREEKRENENAPVSRRRAAFPVSIHPASMDAETIRGMVTIDSIVATDTSVTASSVSLSNLEANTRAFAAGGAHADMTTDTRSAPRNDMR